jgi:fatty acid desaturase
MDQPKQPILTADQESFLRGRSNGMGLYLVLHAWVVIGLSMALFVLWPNPLTFVVAIALIGGRQLGLAILMHDAAHRALFKNTRLNDFVGAHFCGFPVGASLALYRPYHLSHHRHTQQPEDPDLILSAPFPITQASFKRKMWRDILGVTGYQRRLEQFKFTMGKDPSLARRLGKLVAHEKYFIASNATLLLILSVVGVWWAYFVLWLLPLMTWYQLISRLRNIAEHAMVGPADDPLRNTRTTIANPLMRLVLVPYWVNYHLEHHLFVFTPCWKLPRAHRLLRAAGLLERMEVETSYWRVLQKACSASSGPDRRGPRRKTVSHI